MELRVFAERVLFSRSLEEKLRAPDNLTDQHPGKPILAPAMPGRPRELVFKPQTSGKSDFPGLHHLENEEERGRLLHFFANHELLATELMALVLLRFPDAPAAFRKGVLRTLQDEQVHTRLYMNRMKACGIAFGELPVNGYFWRCVSTMENPIDYVASLCLTFEQANLDFARHFAHGFSQIGDADTAGLLDKIYRDEIGHVAYGLKWFRRWKDPGESDWEAFCRTLKFPLSPQRAKGFVLNVAGRRAAGLEQEFIDQLNIYSQSKGRTPDVFVFNPLAEGHIAQGGAFNPTKRQAQLARDLEHLPMFLCRQDDVVLVNRRPAVDFLSQIKQAGIPLPEFVERGTRLLADRKLGRLRPWAWSPDSVELLTPLFTRTSTDKRTAEQCFNPRVARLNSKAWSAGLLQRIVQEQRSAGLPSWLCTEDEIGVAVDSVDAALATVAGIRERGHHPIVVKEAIGVAGSNAIRLFEPALLESQKRWMSRTLARGRQLVIEPWLDRLADFSMQLEMTPDGLKLCGTTGLLTDDRGQFIGNRAESHHHKRIPPSIVALFREPPDISTRLRALYARIFKLLATELRNAEYIGPVGIDAFVYRHADGEPRLKPVVEINPRYTMGRLTVELMKHVCPGSRGLFRLINQVAMRKAGHADFPSYARQILKEHPIQQRGKPVTRLRAGAVCLNDPREARTCLAVFEVFSPEPKRD